MTDEEDQEIADLLMIEAHDRTPMQRQRLEELEGIWEAEQQRFSMSRRLFASDGLRVPGCADMMA